MNLIMKGARFLFLLMAVSELPVPAFADATDVFSPGSTIVYPTWMTGTGKVVVDGVTLPQTEIELGAVCPIGVLCPEHDAIRVRFHWVCGGDDKIDNKYVCPSTGFDVFLTVDGKAVFDPDNIAITGSQFHHVSLPPLNIDGTPCTRGYLIGYVVDTSDRPIKYDGLIGDAVIRNSATAVAAYHAIPIQAEPELAHRGLIGLPPDPFKAGQSSLAFDGKSPTLNHYKRLTGQIYGDVKYDDPVGPIFATTNLTLLTLDVRLNQPNFPTFVDIDFWSEDEVIESTSLHFTCYGQFQLSKLDPNLTKQQMGFRKGGFQSDQAFKSPIGGINDTARPVTLLGLVQTFEGADLTVSERTYIYEPFNNGVLEPTFLLPPCITATGQC
jgi:hypothetical protein